MGRKERLLIEVSEYLKQLHAEEPRPSFDEACAEIRAAATDPADGTFIGIDDGESADITDEAMQDTAEPTGASLRAVTEQLQELGLVRQERGHLCKASGSHG